MAEISETFTADANHEMTPVEGCWQDDLCRRFHDLAMRLEKDLPESPLKQQALARLREAQMWAGWSLHHYYQNPDGTDAS